MSPLLKNLREKRARQKALENLAEAVTASLPLLKHYENQLASSLSCDSRSHDDARESRRQLNAIIESVSRLGIGKPATP